jgi:hypothetical protein
MFLIKIFIVVLIILAYLNLFERSDFLNIIVPSLILIIFYTSLNRNVVGILNGFLIAVGGVIAYDLLWFVFSASVIYY